MKPTKTEFYENLSRAMRRWLHLEAEGYYVTLVAREGDYMITWEID
jgi:SAM-dependent MidA family methyltransferase